MIKYQMVMINGMPHLVRLTNTEIVRGIDDRELNDAK